MKRTHLAALVSLVALITTPVASLAQALTDADAPTSRRTTPAPTAAPTLV